MSTATTASPAVLGRFPATSEAFTPWHDARHWIAGRWCEPQSRREAHDVIDPRHGRAMAQVHLGGADDVDRAVAAAAAAFPAWSEWPIRERAQVMYRLREHMIANLD